MSPQEGDAKAHEIACRLKRLPKSRRAQKLSDELAKIPSDWHELIRSTSGLILSEMEKSTGLSGILSQLSKMNFNQLFKILGFGIGVLALVGMLVVAFACPSPTPFQYLVFRVVIALGAAGAALGLVGVFEIKIKAAAFSLAATATFAIFYAVYQWNPPDLLFERVREDAQTAK